MSSAASTTSSVPRQGTLAVRVLMLDDTVATLYVSYKAIGEELYDEVIRHLQLIESDYFDLEFTDSQGCQCWLNREKLILRQVTSASQLFFKFSVKFYTPDPTLLEDEYTRYLYALQIKRDLASGQLPCNANTAALLSSYIAQAEMGDWQEEFGDSHAYLSGYRFVVQQTDDFLRKVAQYHRTHVGMPPREADFHLLDTARKVEMYGVRLHAARDHEDVPLSLAVVHLGIIVFQHQTKINTFSWAKVRKLSFKRKKFLIKLHPDGCVSYL